MNQKAGFISLLSAAMIFSLLGIAIRFFGTYFGNASQAAMRNIATLGVLVVVMIIRSDSFQLQWKEVKKFAFVSYCVSGATATLFFIVSVMQIKVASTIFYLYVASFVSAFVVGAILFGEKLTQRSLFALTLALIGLIVFSYPIDTLVSWGVVFGLLAGMSDTVHFTSQKYLQNVKGHTLLLWKYIAGAAILLTVSLFANEHMLKPVSLKLVLLIPVFGIMILGLGESILYGFNNFPLNLGTIVVSGELFFAIIINAIALREIPTSTELVGAVLIFSSIVVVNTNVRTKEVRELQPA